MTRTGDARGGVQSRSDHVGEAGVHGVRRAARVAVERAPQLREAYQALRAPRQQLALWRDQVAWHRAVAELRALPAPASDAPVVLAVSTSDRPFDVKLRVLATAGLRQLGWRVVVLTRNRRSTRLHRLYRSAGVDRFVYLDEVVLAQEDQAHLETALEGWLSQPQWTFDGVRKWTYGRSWIGPQVLSSVSRRLLEGAPDPGSPDVRRDIELLLPQVLATAARAEQVVRDLDPALAVLDEYNYTLAGPITDVMTGCGRSLITLRPMFDPQALMPMRLTARSRRVHHATLSRSTLDRLAAGQWTSAHEEALQAEFARRYAADKSPSALEYQAAGAAAVDREGLRELLPLRPDKPLAVVFSHVLWDANLFYGEDLFDNFGHWLAETVRAAAENDRLEWILKLHPANLSKARFHGSSRLNELEIIEREIGRLPRHVHVMMPDAPVSTLSLYRIADVGLTVRGTPGLEMPCFGRPVLTAGTGRYENLGFTVDSVTREAYLERLAHLENVEPLSAEQVQRAKWHAYGLFRLREWRLQSFRIERRAPTARGYHPLEVNLVRSRAEPLVQAADVQALTDWVLASDAVDFIAPDRLAAADTVHA